MKIETAFYSIIGRRQGLPTIRMASPLEIMMELWISEHTFVRAASLVEALRNRTISRRRYRQLVALMVENSLITGQVDETEAILVLMDTMWRGCPASWLPDWRALGSRLLAIRWRSRR